MVIFLKTFLLLFSLLAPQQPVQKEIMPLAIGNKWVYQNHSWNEKGETIAEYKDSLHFISDTLINGERWFVSKEQNISSYYAIRTDGLWGFTSSETKPYLMAKYPSRIGDVFEGKDKGEMRMVLSEHETIIVTSGTFKCVKFYVKSPLYEQESYWCPGVGVIRSIMYRKNDRGDLYKGLEYELVRYTLK